MADAANGRSLQSLLEFLFTPAKEFDQGHVIQPVTDRKVALVSRAGEFVPGTDQLAVVTAIDAITHKRPKFQRNRALVLNSEIRNAAARIQFVRSDDGLGRAYVDAFLAGTAMLA